MTDRCAECGCEAPGHYSRCLSTPAVMKRAFAALEREAEQRRALQVAAERELQRRGNLIRTMQDNSDSDADQTTIYGMKLADMTASEIRIAALWLATQLRKVGKS